MRKDFCTMLESALSKLSLLGMMCLRLTDYFFSCRQYCAWPSVYKMKTKIVMDLKKAADSRAACRMVESD